MRIWMILTLNICLTACAVQLKQASQPWDKTASQPGVPAGTYGKRWGPAGAPEPAGPALRRSDQPASSPSVPGWKVPLPEPGRPAQGAQQTDAGVLEVARQYLGVPYRFGGSTPEEGFDCSGFVQYVFAQRGLRLQRQANHQFLEGQQVSREQLAPGDLVFFSVSGGIVDHVGIYAGEELFIHAPRTGRTVSYDSLDAPYFKTRFQGARRLL
ncbi:MAG: C40 family peptidase [Candidatus Sericytochromatia bacterium]|nr:C40 family peptidase [Candidatus Sericytochromatia bacterium]